MEEEVQEDEKEEEVENKLKWRDRSLINSSLPSTDSFKFPSPRPRYPVAGNTLMWWP